MKQAEGILGRFSKSALSIGSVISGIGAAGGLTAIAKSFATVGDQLDEMSTRTGIGVEALGKLGYAAQFSSVSMQSLAGAVARMQRNLVESPKAFSGLNLKLDELMRMSPDEQLGAIADAINSIKDPARRTAAAMSIFGRSGAELLPFLAEGSKGIRELSAEATRLGLVMTPEMAKRAAALNDQMTRLMSSLTGIKNQIGNAVAPVLIELANRFLRVVPAVVNLISANQKLIENVLVLATKLLGLAAAIMVVKKALSVMSVISAVAMAPATWMAAAHAVGALGFALAALTSPAGLAVLAIAGITTALVVATDSQDEFAAGMVSIAKAAGDEWKKLEDRVTLVGNSIAYVLGLVDPQSVADNARNPERVHTGGGERVTGTRLTYTDEMKRADAEHNKQLKEQADKMKGLKDAISGKGLVSAVTDGIRNGFGKLNVFGNAINMMMGQATNAIANAPIADAAAAASRQAPELIEAGSREAFQLGRQDQKEKTQEEIAQNTKGSREVLTNVLKALQGKLKTTLEGVSVIESFAK